MKKKFYVGLLFFSIVSAEQFEAQEHLDMGSLAPEFNEVPSISSEPDVQILTLAQQDVIACKVAKIENLQSFVSEKELVVEKFKDILRSLGRRIQRGWNWFLRVVRF